MHTVTLLLGMMALRAPCIDLLDAPGGLSGTTPPSATAAELEKMPEGAAAAVPQPPTPGPVPRPKVVSGVDERTTYDVRYGFLGQVGELELSTTPVSFEPGGAPIVRILGRGAGDVLGLGRFERTIETEFDLGAGASRSWRSTRRSSGLASEDRVTDSVIRQAGDKLHIERRKGAAVAPTATAILTPASTTSDPLGVIWRIRNQPPAAGETQVLQLLDGMALWRIELRGVGAAVPVPESSWVGMEIAAQMIPVLYNGQRDPNRPERHFLLWLDAGPGHLPLRLEMPIGIADAILTLKEIRGAPAGSAPPGI